MSITDRRVIISSFIGVFFENMVNKSPSMQALAEQNNINAYNSL